MSSKKLLICGALIFVFAAVSLASLSIGAYPLSLAEALRDLFQGAGTKSAVIFTEIRLPRTLLGILAGATLGLSGAALQGYLRNPLAEPAVLGVNGGAVFGAVLALYTGFSAAHPLALPAGGLCGAFLSTAVVYLLAGSFTSAATMILAGIALNTLFFALTSLCLNLAPNPFAILEIVFWQMGSLSDRGLNHVLLALPFVLTGWALLLWDARALDALSLGEETASSLGISMKSLGLRVLIGTALCVGAMVSVCGSIGFVGLIVPHLLRPAAGHMPSRLLFLSMLGGAALVLAADIAVRLFPFGAELKLGVLTSLMGAPFFLYLLLKMRRSAL